MTVATRPPTLGQQHLRLARRRAAVQHLRSSPPADPMRDIGRFSDIEEHGGATHTVQLAGPFGVLSCTAELKACSK